jgi:hypothetical protein
VNGIGAKCKQLADRAEVDRHIRCKFLDWKALFTGIFHMNAATYKKNEEQPSTEEHGVGSG